MFTQPKTLIQKHEKPGKIRIDVTHIQFTQINLRALDIESLSHQKKIRYKTNLRVLYM